MQGSYGASLVVRAIGTWTIIYGCLIVIGGPARWSNPAYDVVNLMPGSPYTWAILLLLGGVVTMIGSLSKDGLRLPHIHYTRKSLTVKKWNRWFPTIGVVDKDVLIDWNKHQVRNFGLLMLAGWWLLFGTALLFGVWAVPNVGFGAGGNQLLLCVISIVMTKVREPVRQ